MICRFVCVLVGWFLVVVFFFKQKTAYEMRISDWSSDVCSSDLGTGGSAGTALRSPCQPRRPIGDGIGDLGRLLGGQRVAGAVDPPDLQAVNPLIPQLRAGRRRAERVASRLTVDHRPGHTG